MDRFELVIEAEGFEPLHVFDMGEGSIVMEQRDETTGRVHQTSASWQQVAELYSALAPIYGETKNTDQRELIPVLEI